MRRLALGSTPTLYRALAVVVLGVVVGCTGSPADPSPVDPAELPEAEATALINEHAEFSHPLTIEVMSAMVSPTARYLAADGYLSLEEEGTVRAALTEKGRSSGLVEFVFEYGKPYFKVPVAKRELVELTSIEEWPRKIPAKRVTFTYRRSPIQAGKDLLEAGSGLAELQSDRIYAGKATLVLHPDGWQIHTIKL